MLDFLNTRNEDSGSMNETQFTTPLDLAMARSIAATVDEPGLLDRFKVTNPVEIAAFMREAIEKRVLCSVRGVRSNERYLSRMIAVEPGRALMLDPPQSTSILQQLTEQKMIAVDLTLNHVRIMFEVPLLTVAPFQGDSTLYLVFPAEIFRFQRRESYRVVVPARRPVRLTLDSGNPRLRGLRLHDLSLGGASVILKAEAEHFPMGKVFDGSVLLLDADTSFAIAARVRHATSMQFSGTLGDLRVGLQFLRTPPSFEPTVARLVNDIARDLSQIKKS
jgi:c-di-GMP-binding flagellar brake protein YcgR